MEFKDAVNRDIVASRVKYARGCAKLTQAEVAKELGVTPQQVSNYERGLTRIPDSALAKMAKLYKTSVDFFLGDNSKLPVDKELSDTLGDAEKRLNNAELQSAIELHSVFKGFLHYIAMEYPSALPDAANCLELACGCVMHICEFGAKAREKGEYDRDLSKRYLDDIDLLGKSYALFALKQVAKASDKE